MRYAKLGVGMILVLAAMPGCSDEPSKATPAKAVPCVKAEDGKTCLPLAPDSKRADLGKPVFSNPTSITNPLHPTSKVDQVIFGGTVEGKPFRTEFTRLPGTRTMNWNGQQIKTVMMQYLAFSGGRIYEVAIDLFAQADDGAVWYFGEDVYNYKAGVVADREGQWYAGKDGPAAMIMPAKPAVGKAYRSENIPGLVFEEVTVKATGQTLRGPSGPITGAMTVTELHMDGAREEKIFAPGYGEYSTGTVDGELEQASLAVPTDVRPGAAPAQLRDLSTAVRKAFDAPGAATASAIKEAWEAYRTAGVPDLLGTQMTRDVESLVAAVSAKDAAKLRAAALRVAQNDLDLRLRYEPLAKIEVARFDLWARQLRKDAAARDTGAVAGDVACLEWARDRIRHLLHPTAATRIDTQLKTLRAAADRKDIPAITKAIPSLSSAN